MHKKHWHLSNVWQVKVWKKQTLQCFIFSWIDGGLSALPGKNRTRVALRRISDNSPQNVKQGPPTIACKSSQPFPKASTFGFSPSPQNPNGLGFCLDLGSPWFSDKFGTRGPEGFERKPTVLLFEHRSLWVWYDRYDRSDMIWNTR